MKKTGLMILSLSVTLLFAGGNTTEKRHLCGQTANFQDVAKYSEKFGFKKYIVEKASRSVGKLYVSQNQTCSGVLISDDLFITAGHCLATSETTASKTSSLKAIFDYELDENGKEKESKSFRVESIAELGNGYLDYAILKLEGSPGKTFGYLSLQKNVSNGETISIIQHPDGEYKKVDVGHLKEKIEVLLTYKDIDTTNGSGGGAIINSCGELVGIHTHGFYCSEDFGFN